VPGLRGTKRFWKSIKFKDILSINKKTLLIYKAGGFF